MVSLDSPAALSVANLSKVYDGKLKALDDVTLEIPQGTFFGLLGPNGAGKTTLINILGGLTKPTYGTVNVMGFNVVKQAMQARRNIGIVPQEIVFDPFFTTREYLRQQSSYYGIFNNDDWIDEMLENLGLTDKANVNTRKLSGGMKRRMMVAMAMVHKPKVVVLDEPTAGVDVSQRRNLWTFINKLNTDGVTVILTTHNLDEAEELCARIVMLNHGKVLADEKTEELLKHKWHHTKCLFIKLDNGASLPAELTQEHTNTPDQQGRYHIYIDNYAEIEQVTAAINHSGATITELEIAASDLEDVFVAMIEHQGERS